MTDTLAPPPTPEFDITPVSLEEEMERSYLDYAMSVIVSRALPDARDGLKPVHRRILYAMHEEGYEWNRPYRKSARIVGDVMGKYHPHGDQAIYDAMVRMAQDFSMRLPLIDGQGNFGSMDGDPPAAMRYTEVRLTRAAHEMLDDIERETVDFRPNYDESVHEPEILPARIPNLLVNGAGGIAVGMATNVPPHNLGEIVDACLAVLDDPDIGIDSLIDIVPGPDFPTGGIVLGRSGIRSAYHLGRGSVVMRGRTHVEQVGKNREAIVVTEIPYQVNKARMIEKIADLVREKRIEGISDLRDESDRAGVRVVIELRRDAMAEIVLNQLYRFSPLQSTFGVNTLALDRGKPQLMDLKAMLRAFIDFREEVIRRRTVYELKKARERAHVLAGLAVAVANIDEMIALIRAAPDPVQARQALMGRQWPAEDIAPIVALLDEPGGGAVDGKYGLSEAQARAHPGAQAAASHGARARQDRRGAEVALREDRRISGDPGFARPGDRGPPRRAARDQGVLRHAQAHGDRRFRGRPRHRGPDPARGHGRDRDPCGLHQAGRALDLPGAEAGRQGPRRDGDQGRRFPREAVHLRHPHTGAVLLLARHRLPAQGLPPAGGHTAGARQGAWSTSCRWRRARPSPRSCRCPRTRPNGRPSTSCSRPRAVGCGATG